MAKFFSTKIGRVLRIYFLGFTAPLSDSEGLSRCCRQVWTSDHNRSSTRWCYPEFVLLVVLYIKDGSYSTGLSAGLSKRGLMGMYYHGNMYMRMGVYFVKSINFEVYKLSLLRGSRSTFTMATPQMNEISRMFEDLRFTEDETLAIDGVGEIEMSADADNHLLEKCPSKRPEDKGRNQYSDWLRVAPIIQRPLTLLHNPGIIYVDDEETPTMKLAGISATSVKQKKHVVERRETIVIQANHKNRCAKRNLSVLQDSDAQEVSKKYKVGSSNVSSVVGLMIGDTAIEHGDDGPNETTTEAVLQPRRDQ
ncbi:hypothetical protein V6N11_083795 [Hibiscus sabdariffa]|uniref:Uncharacterized protein n=1 Tax=Hibiscus sabdariffa TaxID=183260 RepID=A0ABR2QCV8_9ROSI